MKIDIEKEPLSKEQLNQVIAHLKRAGYRLTPQRLAIVQAVLGSKAHPSAEDIYRQLSATFPMLSRATVYKALEMLKEIGEVVELPVEGRSRYDGNTRPHIHLVCTKCPTMIDLPVDIPLAISEEAAALGFRVHRYSLEIYGLCADCQAVAEEGRPDAVE
ncbi:MAG: Fur family transcriptional regulator [Chloroflexia bacterium]